MADSFRTFIAAELPTEIKKIIHEAQNALKKSNSAVTWVKPDNAHLTLKFLGDVPLENIKEIERILTDIVRNKKSIDSALTTLGAFPKIDHPQIIWIGLEDDFKIIEELAVSVEEELNKFGFKKEARAFSPHITIGRVKSSKNVELLSQEIKNYSPPAIPFTIKNIALFESTLTPSGPVYKELLRVALGQG